MTTGAVVAEAPMTGAPIRVAEKVSPASVPETGGTVAYAFTVFNADSNELSVTSLHDTMFGDLNGQGTCAVGARLASGGKYSCGFSLWIAGSAGDSSADTFTAYAADAQGNTVGDSAVASMTFADVPPDIAVAAVTEPLFVSRLGGSATMTITVTNKGFEQVTLNAIRHTQLGDLVGHGTCVASRTIPARDTYTCSVTETITVSPTVSHVVSVTASDNDGGSDTATAEVAMFVRGHGRTARYWELHPSAWVRYQTTSRVGSVFSVPKQLTFMEALKDRPSDPRALPRLLRAATAALLNTSYYGRDFPQFPSVQRLREYVDAALASKDPAAYASATLVLEGCNNGSPAGIR